MTLCSPSLPGIPTFPSRPGIPFLPGMPFIPGDPWTQNAPWPVTVKLFEAVILQTNVKTAVHNCTLQF